MSSYMRERNVDALLILRNENKWAMTGNFLSFVLIILLSDVLFFPFSFNLFFGFGFYMVFSFSR